MKQKLILIMVISFTIGLFSNFSAQAQSDRKNSKEIEKGNTQIDNQTYKTVEIDGRIWLAEDLKINIPDETEIVNDSYFYTWDAAQKIDTLYDGWRLPTSDDYEELIEVLGGKKKAKKKLIAGSESYMNMELQGIVLRPTKRSPYDYFDSPYVYYFTSTSQNNSPTIYYGLWISKVMGVQIKIYPINVERMKCCVRLIKDEK